MVRAIVGSSWGDEGKGKITDLLAGEADAVVRFQGGANAGHTIINAYGKNVLHLLPSGVFNPEVMNVIAGGVALDAEMLFAELEMLREKGVPKPRLAISARAQLLLPVHRLQDRLEEKRSGRTVSVPHSRGSRRFMRISMRKRASRSPSCSEVGCAKRPSGSRRRKTCCSGLCTARTAA